MNIKIFVLVLSLAAILSRTAESVTQPLPTRDFGDFVVTIGPEAGETGTWFRVSWNDGTQSTYVVPNVFDPAALAEKLSSYQSQRLIVRTAKKLVVLDARSGTVIDEFLALSEKQSPDGRFIAIQRHTPNGVEFVDSVYSVYDLQRNPAQNRPTGFSGADAGTIVFPDANVQAQRYRMAVAESNAHTMLSAFWWLTPSMVAFVDSANEMLQLVLVDVSAGGPSFRANATTIDSSALFTTIGLRQIATATVQAMDVQDTSPSTVSVRLIFKPQWFLRTTSQLVVALLPQ